MSIADSFGRSGSARFINSTVGRVTRVIAGLAIIAGGYLLGGPSRVSRMPGSGA